jgi:phosphoribosylformimino-5-aminoimidazole carboxamide ribotide isomerase
LVQLIDLDAALGTGNNRSLVERFTKRLSCQLGGGIRTVEDATTALQSGAQRIIVGSSLVDAGQPNTAFAEKICAAVGRDRLVFALDSKEGRVAVHGWRQLTNITAPTMMLALEPWCSAFLYTHVETEGLMRGLPLEIVRPLRPLTRNQLIVAGGIASPEEVEQLDALSVDAVVGMAIYTGRLRV